MPGDVEWIYVPGATRDEDDSDDHGHGTCVLAWAVSPKYGVAKNADSVIVKLPVHYDEQRRLGTTVTAILTALIFTLGDVRTKGLQRRAVVNFSWGCK
jgi:hypothetical protein